MADEKRDEAQQEDQRQEDLELPEETAEQVKGGWDWIKTPKKLPNKG
jgi:hypothetical protein